jgi:DNA-binding GntR family transcriptional regulator
MTKPLSLQRARDGARDLVRQMIVTGELPPDAHVEEIKLSEQIGVSRTPVREALIALEQEGLVRSRPRRGFVVVRPDVAMVRESYPILSALETAAVRLTGEKLPALAPKLKELNAAMSRERKKSRLYNLDRAFHATLTNDCGNARLLTLLNAERTRAALIDGAHARGMANVEGSVSEHGAIIEAIERGALARAINILTQHWAQGTEVVVRWLDSKQ